MLFCKPNKKILTCKQKSYEIFKAVIYICLLQIYIKTAEARFTEKGSLGTVAVADFSHFPFLNNPIGYCGYQIRINLF